MSFMFIKVGDEAFAPLQVALGRLVFGAATLLVLLPLLRDRLPRELRTWIHLAIVAILVNALPFSLFAYGEQRVSSVVAGIWNAATPLMTVPFALLLLADERLTRERAG